MKCVDLFFHSAQPFSTFSEPIHKIEPNGTNTLSSPKLNFWVDLIDKIEMGPVTVLYSVFSNDSRSHCRIMLEEEVSFPPFLSFYMQVQCLKRHQAE